MNRRVFLRVLLPYVCVLIEHQTAIIVTRTRPAVGANRFQPDASTPCVHMSEQRSSCETGYLSPLSHWDESAGRRSPTWRAIWSNHRRRVIAVEHPTGARRNHNERDAVQRQVHCGELSFPRHRLLGRPTYTSYNNCFNSTTNAEMSGISEIIQMEKLEL